MPTTPPWLIVTAEQLKKGWQEYRPDEIPNVVQRPFQVIADRHDGTYCVRNPELTVLETAGRER